FREDDMMRNLNNMQETTLPNIPLRHRILNNVKRAWGLYLLLLIPVIYVFIFNYIPMYGVSIAFKRYNIKQGIIGSPWVGLYHFERFLGNSKFYEIIRNTVVLSVYNLLAEFPFSILLAIGLTHMGNKRYRKVVQMVTYAPYFLSTVVMVALISQLLNLRFGVINRLIASLGFDTINFMGQANTFRHVYVWSGVWQHVGYGAIIYISALSSVDPQIHEAAIVDGASIWRRIWNVDIPSILPTITIMLILRMGSIMGVGFEKTYLMQNATNISVSEVIETYVYRVGIIAQRPDFSFGTAIGLFQNVISLVLVIATNFISRRISDNGLW
ncbi:ABC transporter permease, partial [Muricomes intestini]|uniref:ABC transporter permease n=1 Tax=Muricomes intestini TaxID=1796634 RepID=UPI002FE1D1C0